MDDAYVELKGVPEMKGSINTVISAQRKLYRPPSLSESFAWTPENVLRANASNNSLDLLVIPQSPSNQTSPRTDVQITPPPNVTTKWNKTKFINYTLRFLFHISLISIFESVFFFLYISKLEDNGINRTVGTFVNDALDVCMNFTSQEQTLANDVLRLFLNSTEIIDQGNAAYTSRSALNQVLFVRSWMYVAGLGGLFTFLTMISLFQGIKIKWRKLILENIALVTLLAAYEYTFFATIIFPYNPITGEEIARNALLEIQGNCGLL